MKTLKIIIGMIIIALVIWGVWYKIFPSAEITKENISYTKDNVEINKDNQTYIYRDNPDQITDDTYYAYKLYPAGDCQAMFIYENETPAGKKIAKLELCQDTIAKFEHLDNGWIIIQTECGLEYRKNILTGQEIKITDLAICPGSLTPSK